MELRDNNLTRGGHILHEQEYNTGHGIQAIPDEVRGEIRRSRASRKYNKSRSYIYFWKNRWDGTRESLACQSRRPHHHPNQHTEAELKLIRDMRRRNPHLGMVELWHRLRQRGYTRRPESLFRVMRKLGLFPQAEKKPAYKPKPYEQMTYPGQRVQVDVKVVPRRCIADPELRLFQYTAIDEFTRLRFLAAYPEQSSYSSADFLKRLVKWYARRGIRVECVQTDNGPEFTNRFSTSRRDCPSLFESDRCPTGHPPQAHPSLYPAPQRQGGAQPPGGPETLLFLPQLLFPGRLRKAARRPQPPLQQLPHEAPRLVFPLRVRRPICLTNLNNNKSRLFLVFSFIKTNQTEVCPHPLDCFQ